MRIALITDGIWPYVLGGMQKHSYYLCKYLAREKVYIDLFHYNQSSYNISQLEYFTEEEKKFITSHIVSFPSSIRFPGHYLFNSYRYSKKIFTLIQSRLNSYDLIYTKGFTGWYLLRQKKAGLQCPLITVKFHGYEMFQQAPDIRAKLQQILFLRKPVRTISRMADIVFSYGGKITHIIEDLGVSSEKIFELPSGIENEMLADKIVSTGNNIKFVFLGRYERRKGIEELNEAVRKITGNNERSASFHFIGPIPENKKLNLPGVTYYGEIRDKARLKDLLRRFDVLVCPSWSEGMPNVILEAMGNGLAVLATNTGATNILVNDKTGWLLEKGDPQLIYSALTMIMKSKPVEIDAKKQNALELVTNNFTWEILISGFINKIRKNDS